MKEEFKLPALELRRIGAEDDDAEPVFMTRVELLYEESSPMPLALL